MKIKYMFLRRKKKALLESSKDHRVLTTYLMRLVYTEFHIYVPQSFLFLFFMSIQCFSRDTNENMCWHYVLDACILLLFNEGFDIVFLAVFRKKVFSAGCLRGLINHQRRVHRMRLWLIHIKLACF